MLKFLLVYIDHGQGPFPHSKQIGFSSVLNPLTSSCKAYLFSPNYTDTLSSELVMRIEILVC